MTPPIRDDSASVWHVIVVALLLITAFMGAYIYETGKKQPPAAESAARGVEQVSPAVPQSIPSDATVPPRQRYAEPAMPTGPSDAQMSRYRSMQEYCYRMARMNSEGDYPALQRAACSDFARYAGSIGLGTGQLPTVLVKREPLRQSQNYSQSATTIGRSPPPICGALEGEKQSINAATRQAHSWQEAEWYRERLRKINARMYELNCQNH